MKEGNELPEGWVECAIKEISVTIRGVTYSKGESQKITSPNHTVLLRSNNIRESINYDDLIFVKNERINQVQILKKNDVLIAMSSGSKNLVGKASQIKEKTNSTFGSFCGAVRPDKCVDPKYFGFFFRTKNYRKKVSDLSKGSNINNLKQEHIDNIVFPLPPLNEQNNISEKIETLFAQIDKGEEAVREAQTLLKRYRQSVLKAAVTGALTADWRADRAGTLEHGQDLLDRILKTRRENWSGRGKYKDPIPPDTAGLPNLPNGWAWASIDQILRAGLSNGRSVPDAEIGFPVLRLTALKDSRIDILERKIGAWDVDAADPFLIARDDVLISRGNGSIKLVGKGGLVEVSPDPVAFPDTMIRIPLNLNFIDAWWFVQVWNSPFMRAQIQAAAKTTAGIHKINQTDIRKFNIPIPTKNEQDEISNRLHVIVEQIINLEALCEAELKRSASLRQSVLKDAFSGKLVPQSPDDEPASVLLERIKSARAEASKTKSAKPKTGTSPRPRGRPRKDAAA